MNVIQLAMEIPTCRLEQWSPLADLDFILAHTVLEDAAYAQFFHDRNSRQPGRELILDNSYHELGVPLSISDLAEAAKRVQADFVITPDRIGDLEFNLKSFNECDRVLSPKYKLAVVMTGTEDGTSVEREDFLIGVQRADMLCCTFKQPKRLDWYYQSFVAKRFPRVHLLGVSELKELRKWAEVAHHLSRPGIAGPKRKWSVDTGKALKWALKDKYLSQLPSLRTNALSTSLGQPSVVSQQLLSLKDEDLSEHVEMVFKDNVRILKECCK